VDENDENKFSEDVRDELRMLAAAHGIKLSIEDHDGHNEAG